MVCLKSFLIIRLYFVIILNKEKKKIVAYSSISMSLSEKQQKYQTFFLYVIDMDLSGFKKI